MESLPPGGAVTVTVACDPVAVGSGVAVSVSSNQLPESKVLEISVKESVGLLGVVVAFVVVSSSSLVVVAVVSVGVVLVELVVSDAPGPRSPELIMVALYPSQSNSSRDKLRSTPSLAMQ